VLKIGNIDLGEHPVLLAPMEDITDPSFRFLCKEFEADLVYTEFISSDGLIRKGKKSIKKLDIYDFERPIGIQLYGHLIDSMVEAAVLAEQSKPELIDINFGCPVKKIANRGAGSGMLRTVPLMIKITEAIVKATRLPVTVKTRLGWDESSKNIIEVAEQLQDAGITALTIHGRTRNQLYNGQADWKLIGEVKNNPRMKIPIIGNGDIDSAEKAKSMFNQYGVDAIMIGRASIGRPWIFKEIKTYLTTGHPLPEMTIKAKVELAKRHLAKSIEFKGFRRGVFEMRRHFVHYFKGLDNFRETRIKLLTEEDPNKLNEILNEIKNRYEDIVTF
jgi:tRNA-dihydrouridine synthase B